MENRIKECQLDLFADRTSTASLSANQLRLWFASLAYVLMTALRRDGVARNGTCESHSRNHPAQTPEAWSAGDGQRAAHQDRRRVRLPHEGRVRECSPATMFRRRPWRTRPVPPSKRHCRGSSARFATPARKPCLSKQGVRLSTPPMNKNSGITTLVRNAG